MTSKFSVILGWLNQALNNPAQDMILKKDCYNWGKNITSL